LQGVAEREHGGDGDDRRMADPVKTPSMSMVPGIATARRAKTETASGAIYPK
jgi:hypothetical protein